MSSATTIEVAEPWKPTVPSVRASVVGLTEPPIPTNTVGFVNVNVKSVGVFASANAPVRFAKPSAETATLPDAARSVVPLRDGSTLEKSVPVGSTTASREPTASWSPLTPTTDAARPCTATP